MAIPGDLKILPRFFMFEDMPLTFKRSISVWSVVIFLLFYLAPGAIQAQKSVGYKLNRGYDANSDHPHHVGLKGERFTLNWSIVPDEMPPDNSLSGKMKVYLSADSILSPEDEMILSRDVDVEFYTYRTDELPTLQGGYHYLIQTFTTDLPGFRTTCDPLVTSVVVVDFTMTLKDVFISHFRTSEYDHSTRVDIKIEMTTPCCTSEIGDLNGYLKIFLSEDEMLDDADIALSTFYPDESLSNGVNILRFEDDLFIVPEFDDYKNVVVSFEEGYFANAFQSKIEKRFVVPLKVVTDIAQVNEHRRKDHPYLTYGSFDINAQDLEGMDLKPLMNQAGEFYAKVNEAITAAKTNDYAGFFAAADTAFAMAGRNAVSSLLYVHPNTISSLYALFIDIAEKDSIENEFSDPGKTGFRLGEAMNMAALMDSAYTRLRRSIFPNDLEIENAVERAGYFDAEGEDPFMHPAIRTPILWREVSTPAVAHFLRITEYEEADQIIHAVREIYDDVLKIGSAAAPLISRYPRVSYLTDALIYDSDVWEFYVNAMRFYGIIGDYEAGMSVYRFLQDLSYTQDEIFLTEFRAVSAEFFETFHEFEKADSLYQALDAFHLRRAREFNSAVEVCHAFNSAALQQRLNPTQERDAIGREYEARVAAAGDSDSWFALDELLNNKLTSFKHGIFSLPAYDRHYLSQIQMLEMQNQFFAASELKKDLAFFLGRDRRYDDAFAVYESLFPIENFKLTAFRGSFNEEAQLFNTAKHLDMFSRYVNLLTEMPDTIAAEIRDAAVRRGFEQMLFYHSFILRGNFRMLYNVRESNDPAILAKFEIWKAYRQLLNQVYVSDEVSQEDVRKVKAELVNTEKELQRMSRDSLYFLEGAPADFKAIKSQLKPGEAAIEIMRVSVNHERYYGEGIRYVAFLVTADADKPQLVSLETPGDLLEGRFFNYYRSAIRGKFADTISYKRFFEPVLRSIGPGVKKVWFAPDGVFNLINPATIYNPASGRYLSEDIAFAQVSSIAYVGEAEDLQMKDGVFYGNPNFIRETKSEDSRTSEVSGRFAVLANPVAELPGTRAEVESIGKLLKSKGVAAKTYLGSNVTKKNIYASRKTDILHFATHGYWLDEKSSKKTYTPYASLSHSALLLTGAQLKDKNGYRLRRDGILTAAEIQNMDLFGTRLVVLSACETGLGEVVPGEGIYGLKRAFQRAGVKYLVSSLWKVDDKATQKFMQHFYGFLVQDKEVSSAFERAVKMIRTEYPEPYYWGAFALTQFY